jgi:hypothetical protein
MTAVFIIGFLVGAGVMLHRVVSTAGATGRWPRSVIGWLSTLVIMVFGGLVFAILFSIVAEPVIRFVQRVDALERRCPDASRPQ